MSVVNLLLNFCVFSYHRDRPNCSSSPSQTLLQIRAGTWAPFLSGYQSIWTPFWELRRSFFCIGLVSRFEVGRGISGSKPTANCKVRYSLTPLELLGSRDIYTYFQYRYRASSDPWAAVGFESGRAILWQFWQQTYYLRTEFMKLWARYYCLLSCQIQISICDVGNTMDLH